MRTLVVVSLLGLASVAHAETITYGPILGRGQTGDKMVVKWGTSSSGDATAVSYRKQGAASFTVVTGAASKDHEVLLTGLDAGSTYEYFVTSGAASSSTYAFPTCPAPGAPMDLVFYGDNRSDAAEHQTIVDLILTKAPDMVFSSGDIYATGSYSGYLSEFFPVAKALVATTPFMASPGNHDNSSTLSSNYGKVFPMARASLADAWQPYYAFSCGNAMFIALNSNDVNNAAQQSFLTSSLAAAQADASIEHVFAYFHHAAYSPGSHGDTSDVQTQWVPVFEDPANTKMRAVFNGHDHIYARMQHGASKVLYVVSGGAGADLYSVSGGSGAAKVTAKSSYNFTLVHLAGGLVTGTAYDDAGAVIDTFSAGMATAGSDGGTLADGGDLADLGASESDAAIGLSDGPSTSDDPSGKTSGCAMAASPAPLAPLALLVALTLTRRRRRA